MSVQLSIHLMFIRICLITGSRQEEKAVKRKGIAKGGRKRPYGLGGGEIRGGRRGGELKSCPSTVTLIVIIHLDISIFTL